MRILHFSDPHLPTPLSHVPLGKWLSKRAIGGANLLMGRYRLFAAGVEKLGSLARFKTEQQVDLVLCTGDYTSLGLKHEYETAVNAVRGLMDAPLGYVNVPGNHDYYLTDALREERFRTYFNHTLSSDLPEYQVDGPWPLVRLVGEDIAVIAVNSSRPNPQPWRSSGKIPERQLAEMKKLSQDSRVSNRQVFIMTHYAPLRADGEKDSRLHGLVNGDTFLLSCSEFHRPIILCGHVHQTYQVIDKVTGDAIFCAGSATMEGKEGFWLFDISGDEIWVTAGKWNGHHYQLNEDTVFKIGDNTE
jgi:3',5'-cyclic AMP phosphodiesterase CpdA